MPGIERKGQQLGSIRVPVVEEGEDLSKMLKADLVDRATTLGIDTEGLNKADIVAALEKHAEGEG